MPSYVFDEFIWEKSWKLISKSIIYFFISFCFNKWYIRNISFGFTVNRWGNDLVGFFPSLLFFPFSIFPLFIFLFFFFFLPPPFSFPILFFFFFPLSPVFFFFLLFFGVKQLLDYFTCTDNINRSCFPDEEFYVGYVKR